MNNENQTNQNLNNNGMNSMPIGNVGPMPNPTPQPNEPLNNVAPTPVPNGGSVEPPVNNMNPPVNAEGVPPVQPSPTPAPAPTSTPNPVPTPEVSPAAATPGVTPPAAPEMGGGLNLGPIEQPIPGTTNMGPGNTMSNSNGFVETKRTESFGTNPPAANNPKEKKPMNKVVFIILIVVLLAAIAFGVYYYLSMGQKSKISVTTKNVSYNLNELLSSNVSDYATITGTDPKNCTLDLTNVDNSTEGVYQYVIKCEDEKFTGNVSIINNILPSAQPKDVFAVVAAEGTTPQVSYTANDFVEVDSCTVDDCTYAFANKEMDINTYLHTTGTYKIDIIVTDASGKTGSIISNLVVLKEPIRLFLACTLEGTAPNPDIVTDYIAMGAENYSYINYAYRLTTFKFSNAEEYNNVVADKKSTISYNDVEGVATYDDATYSLTIKSDLTDAMLNLEAGGTFPTSYADVGTYYRNKNYNCQIVQAPTMTTPTTTTTTTNTDENTQEQ